jgi:CheY-like chemotaxis protein
MKVLEKIMVVEDDADIRDILELSLASVGGFHVSLFGDARSALAALPENRPDMILLDLMLPDLGGLEALPLIRAEPAGAGATVVLLTAMAGADVREEFLARGVQEVLFKPFDPMSLPRVLAGIWLATRVDD